MTAPYQHEEWEDGAEAACLQWITSWRSNHRGELLPSLRFAAHLGTEARSLQAEGVSRLDLQRTFADLGYGGVCVCGADPGSMPGRPPMLETRPRKRRVRRAGAA